MVYIALVVSVLGSPCVIGGVLKFGNLYIVPAFDHQYSRLRWVPMEPIWIGTIVGNLISLITVGRILLSRGRLLGLPVALLALFISSLLWIATALVIIMLFCWGGPQ
jgi:hypothetical protein